jgi:hypothetical protein
MHSCKTAIGQISENLTICDLPLPFLMKKKTIPELICNKPSSSQKAHR